MRSIIFLNFLGLQICICPCFNLSKIAIGLDKSACSNLTCSCIGLLCNHLGRTHLKIGLAHFDSISSKIPADLRSLFSLFDFYAKSGFDQWALKYPIIDFISKMLELEIPFFGASLACCLGGYLCYTMPLCNLRTEAREKYEIKVQPR